MKLYFKRHFDEDRIEDSEIWGKCDYYFETNQIGEFLRQIEVYSNGKRLKYSEDKIEDQRGGLAEHSLDLSEFAEFAIDKNEFEHQWQT